MKFFVISDVHGNFDKMLAALIDAGFDKSNASHMLVSLGDLFDRGTQSKEVLLYIMSLPHRLLVCGNHDQRLQQIVRHPDWYDKTDTYNGMRETFASFGYANAYELHDAFLKGDGIMPILRSYFQQLSYAIETPQYILTHGWLPMHQGTTQILPNWRSAGWNAWNCAMWADTCKCLLTWPRSAPANGKILVVGHWATCNMRAATGNHAKDFDIFYSQDKHLVGIDGTAALPLGHVNVFTFEEDLSQISLV